MFQVEICSHQLDICKSVCMFIVLAIVVETINFRLFCSDDCRSWPRDEKINNHECWGKHAHIPDNDYWGICLFHVVWTIFFLVQLFTRNIFLLASDIVFINWTVRMSDNLPEKVQILGHAHIICITVRENRIICCQIYCELLLKSAFERIFNVMQLILVKIKWHIKWKYLIQKFHDICPSYYFKPCELIPVQTGTFSRCKGFFLQHISRIFCSPMTTIFFFLNAALR